ncbi:MAG: hypothetical protein M3Y85_10855 [Bacteroidota bacterium]|nr:hypothetical protein [Bacteroidota bacterium]
MKKIILLPVAFLMLNCKGLYAQTLNDSLAQLSKPELSHYYESKAKHQKTTGLVMATTGLVLFVVGAAVFASNFSFDLSGSQASSSDGGGGVIAIVGGISLLGSLPVLISSAHNRRKARLILENKTTYLTPTLHLKQTAIGISIPLGR